MMLIDAGQRVDSFMPVRRAADTSGASSERRRAYDDDRAVQGGHSHGHHRDRAGDLGQALRQTLDQLGISVGGKRNGDAAAGTTTTTTITITITTRSGANPAASGTTNSTPPATTAPVAADPTDTTTPVKTPPASTSPPPNTEADAAPSASRADLHALMHSLFQAVRGEARHGSGHGLSDALGSLAADAANGTAPSALQEAFERLTAGNTTSTDSGAPTLQQFLLALQQNLGGSDSGTGHTLPYQPTGNLLAILA